MILAMSHPLNNVKVNIGVMAQSATCGQEKALNETKALVKSAVAPMQSKQHLSRVTTKPT
jgi:hypothetical protein